MTKKRLITVCLLCAIIMLVGIGAACARPYYGTAIIDGINSDRVHLREQPSTQSASLGLYFTGTEVSCNSDMNDEWVSVTIGAESGYMMSSYLYDGDPYDITPKQPTGTARPSSAGGWVNLRYTPTYFNSGTAGQLYNGDTVTVLGETSDGWYYVCAGDIYGYVASDYLVVGGSAQPVVRPTAVPAQGYEMLSYTHLPQISIAYPYFTGYGMEWLNDLIYSKVEAMAENENSDLTADYECAVTLLNSKMASVVFWGYTNITGSLHPTTDLYAYNFDLSAMRELTLRDLYDLNAGFEQVFFSRSYFPTAPITSYDASSFAEMLRMQTPQYQSISPFATDDFTCFLKPEGIVISLPAVHATGSDHFEAQLRYSDIQAYYLPYQNYWQD